SQNDSPARQAWGMFVRNRAAVFGLVLFSLVLIFAIVGPFLYDVDPFKIVWRPFTPPGTDADRVPIGTDYLGRDLLAGLIDGADSTLLVGATAATITVVIGVVVGAMAGYYGQRVDNILMRVTEFFQVLPPLLFAMVIVALFSPSLLTISLAIGVVSWPQMARLTRAEFLKIKNLEYVRAERAIGSSDATIIWRVILPNAAPPLIVSATLIVGAAILFEAGLSFLGLGDPNVVTWGSMIGFNRPYILDAWWTVALPGMFIFVTVLSISLIGDGLNVAFNPKLRDR
ncbi:MAG: ABC transporter permease, partial [Candidatus Promineifilaceae bacterium]